MIWFDFYVYFPIHYNLVESYLLISLKSRIKHNKHIKSKSSFKMNRPKDFKNKNSTTFQHHQQKQHKKPHKTSNTTTSIYQQYYNNTTH